MGDIKRNEDDMSVKQGKEVDVSATKKPAIQLERGNLDLVSIRLLEAINKNLAEIIKLLKEKK